MSGRWQKLVARIACAAVVAMVWSPGMPRAADSLNEVDRLLISRLIMQYIQDAYYDTISNDTLYMGSVEGMISKLDPHSSYMPPDDAAQMDEKLQGGFDGIGVTFAIIDGKITVIEVIPGGPSEAAGLKSRDKIVKIEDTDAVGIDTDQVKQMLRGPAGTRVTVQIERPGETGRRIVPITRGQVELNSVSHAYMIDSTTGYIALTQFSMISSVEVQQALRDLEAQGMQRLVLDLRNNSGGSLDAATRIVDLFINDGVIVETRGRRVTSNRTVQATARGRDYTDLPMIVMINHASASAAEIVAGALQDHDRALIVGQTSFGKGLVMNIFELRRDNINKELGTLLLTTAQYYTPSGRLIQRPFTDSRDEYVKEGLDDIDPNAQDADKTGMSTYYTDLGREVYGGGGITPDIALTSMQLLNPLEQTLRNSNLFFEYVDQYLLRATGIPKDFDTFLASWRIPDTEIQRFREFIVSKDVEVDTRSVVDERLEEFGDNLNLTDDQVATLKATLASSGVNVSETIFDQSIGLIRRELKMEIARVLWGSDARYRVWHADDSELAETMTHFTDAEELLENRLALGNL